MPDMYFLQSEALLLTSSLCCLSSYCVLWVVLLSNVSSYCVLWVVLSNDCAFLCVYAKFTCHIQNRKVKRCYYFLHTSINIQSHRTFYKHAEKRAKRSEIKIEREGF